MSLVPRQIVFNGGRRAPRRDLALGAGAVDRLFDELWSGFSRTPSAFVAESEPRFVPRIDVTETDEEYQVSAELPGLDAVDFEVVIEDGLLTLRGEKRSGDGAEETRWHRAETRGGRFERKLRFALPVIEEEARAEYKHGVLKVVLPKAEEARPHVVHVPITTA